jgi:DNA-binding CsgD family transcriptional regulator
MPSQNYSAIELGKLASMRAAGYSTQEIADVLNRTHASIENAIQRYKIPRANVLARQSHMRRWTSLEVATLKHYKYTLALSNEEIARKMGRNVQSINNKLRQEQHHA